MILISMLKFENVSTGIIAHPMMSRVHLVVFLPALSTVISNSNSRHRQMGDLMNPASNCPTDSCTSILKRSNYTDI